MKNPLNATTRGHIYVASIVTSGAALVLSPVLVVLGLETWAPVLAGAVSAVGLVASSLARDNLSDPTVGLSQQQTNQVWAIAEQANDQQIPVPAPQEPEIVIVSDSGETTLDEGDELIEDFPFDDFGAQGDEGVGGVDQVEDER